MKHVGLIISIAVTLLTSVGCDHRAREFQNKTAILQSINIPAEVKANIAKGDKQLRGCQGEGSAYIPGLDVFEIDPVVQPLVQKYGLYFMEDVSDVIEGEAHATYTQVAYEYAERYNRLLLQELGEVFVK